MIIQRHELDALFQNDALVPELADTMPAQDVLMLAFEHVRATFMHALFDTKALYYPQLDAILQRLSERLYDGAAAWAPGSGLQLIIGSQFFAVGGHSRVAKNFARLAPRNVVIVTDPFDQQTPAEKREMQDFFAPLPVLFLPAGDLAFKADFLRTLILQLQPDYASCFNHHVDPLPVVAIAAAPVPRKIFFHHCDYRPSLGASLSAFVHVDINAKMGSLCGGHCGGGVQVLDLHDAQVAEPAQLSVQVAGRPLNTVSAGSVGKYTFGTEPAPLSYPHVVLALLRAGDGMHHHFGQMPEQHQAFIRGLLAQSGVDAARFVYHGNVASVQQALLAIENPVYVPSFPVGGALMIVEVLSAGVPVLINANTTPTDSYDFMNASHLSLMPERYLAFTAMADIAPALQAIGADYNGYAQSSNDGFARRHSQASFLAGLDRLKV
jgi:hypothetical protein